MTVAVFRWLCTCAPLIVGAVQERGTMAVQAKGAMSLRAKGKMTAKQKGPEETAVMKQFMHNFARNMKYSILEDSRGDMPEEERQRMMRELAQSGAVASPSTWNSQHRAHRLRGRLLNAKPGRRRTPYTSAEALANNDCGDDCTKRTGFGPSTSFALHSRPAAPAPPKHMRVLFADSDPGRDDDADEDGEKGSDRNSNAILYSLPVLAIPLALLGLYE
eukprot:GEMP01033318.1.p1 GENE.GEMP01033318.1~~GEMP01033318.1.p1  ORF type:complete len:218 (+),score=55.35 GEMP01033318.1:156-809(+)